MVRTGSTNTAVGYVRRSTDRQEQSIDDQKNILSKYAQDNGIRLNKFYVDNAISGTYTLKRKAFLQMISDAERDPRIRMVLFFCKNQPTRPCWEVYQRTLLQSIQLSNRQ